jgi:hypothetical protein
VAAHAANKAINEVLAAEKGKTSIAERERDALRARGQRRRPASVPRRGLDRLARRGRTTSRICASGRPAASRSTRGRSARSRRRPASPGMPSQRTPWPSGRASLVGPWSRGTQGEPGRPPTGESPRFAAEVSRGRSIHISVFPTGAESCSP